MIADAYGRRQPITGISSLIASIGLAALFWWFTLGVTTSDVLGVADPGVAIGTPFVWFGATVTFSFAMGMWPFKVKQPAHFILWIGYLVFYSLIYLWFLHALNMDFFVGPVLHGATYTIIIVYLFYLA